jgi:putative PEP-CTERM system histidine kinase
MEESLKVFCLEDGPLDWHETLREHCPSQFPHGGERLGVILRTPERCLGVMVLADRVGGAPYSQEERDLLSCLGDQLASGLLNIRLGTEQMESKELEAFQRMSTFFVHDLKNAANSLGLMIQNLPDHFDDPEFREDALRGLGKSADRINKMISQLSNLRAELQPVMEDCDLNELVRGTLGDLGSGYNVTSELGDVPKLWIDLGRIRSVLTNLVINASEASTGKDEVQVKTSSLNGMAIVEVSDRGCGMTAEFIRDSLFKPFSSTKSKGLGIGMFQSKIIVEAHRGTIEVQSTPQKGTVFRVLLPLE